MMKTNRLAAASFMLAASALALAGCETVVENISKTYHASLSGAEEVPGPGDPDGVGRAEVSVSDRLDELCYEIAGVSGIGTPTAAHIHQGAKGVAGPPVVTLDTPRDGSSKGCANAPESVADAIKANPSGFYVNVHNAEFPNGAIRGQLAD